jgi:hypothetical protein
LNDFRAGQKLEKEKNTRSQQECKTKDKEDIHKTKISEKNS